nr:PREDICTED: ubiquitin carboxyl-terminal hydrolase 2-like [Bemisia tabaci]XP_018896419.1 PREDICTED: ubiquitin carboxyl-terminal hydrolase 2-like [Bemisia tabaci]XP_018896420.1 PREDICTED: ubiquitin carboxyl-terminal hydrolase 2-like [Bemisia tabaci]
MPVPLKLRDPSFSPVVSTSMTLHGKPPKYSYSSGSDFKPRGSGAMSRSSSLLASHSRSYISPARSAYFGPSIFDDDSSRDGSESRDTSFASSPSYNSSSLSRNFLSDKSSSKELGSSNNAYRRSSPISVNFDVNDFMSKYSPDNYVPGTYRSKEKASSSFKSNNSDDLEVRASRAVIQPRYPHSLAPMSSAHENFSSSANFNSNSTLDPLGPKMKAMHLTDENHNMVGYSITNGEDKCYSDLANSGSRNKKCYNCPSPAKDTAERAVVKGLRNVGNTCFMNSVLQCLNRTPPLVSYILNHEYINDLTNSKCADLFRAFAELIEKMNDNISRSPISAQSFKNELQQYARQFVGRNQHDAQEFLRYLLQGLHEAINQGQKKITSAKNLDDLSESEKAEESWRQYNILERSKIIDFFVGQMKSSLKCTVCDKCSNTYEIFWDVSLPLPELSSRTTLRDCLTEFTKEEVLDGKNMPVCAGCKKPRKCTKRFQFQKLPKILVLHLKRFTSYTSPTSSYLSSRWTRSSVNVDFPMNLDMTEFASTRELSAIKYSLYGFSCHSGTLDAGHYVAYCKNIRTDEWFEFNDSEVIPVSTSEVLRKQPYLLFYQQIGSASEVYHV